MLAVLGSDPFQGGAAVKKAGMVGPAHPAPSPGFIADKVAVQVFEEGYGDQVQGMKNGNGHWLWLRW